MQYGVHTHTSHNRSVDCPPISSKVITLGAGSSNAQKRPAQSVSLQAGSPRHGAYLACGTRTCSWKRRVSWRGLSDRNYPSLHICIFAYLHIWTSFSQDAAETTEKLTFIMSTFGLCVKDDHQSIIFMAGCTFVVEYSSPGLLSVHSTGLEMPK